MKRRYDKPTAVYRGCDEHRPPLYRFAEIISLHRHLQLEIEYLSGW
ncbi:hypothetical protein [Sphingomonas faeni]|nr:hypothetical protein [Sphingomonas faeni]